MTTAAATTVPPREKIMCGKGKKKSHANIQRKCESECFSMGVVHLRAETMCTMMNTQNPFEPKDKEEAAAIAEGCAYVGAMVPTGCCALLEKLPVPKKQYVYCNLPFVEKKETCIAYGAKRDSELNVEYDRIAKRCRGGVADPRDVNENQTIARELGIRFGQYIDVEDESPDDIGTVDQGLSRAEKEKYEKIIAGAVFGFQQAQNEANLLRTTLETLKKTWEDNESVNVPEIPVVTPGFKKAQKLMDKLNGSLNGTVTKLIDRYGADVKDTARGA